MNRTRIINRFFHMLYSCLLLIMAFSCKKNEFMAPPQGADIPYEAPMLTTLQKELGKPEYAIYKSIWDRINMDSILTADGTRSTTIFLLDNNTLNTAGITTTNVSNLSDTAARKLVRYHCLKEKIDINALRSTQSGVMLTTFLTDPTYSRGSYLYRLNFAYANGSFVLDGNSINIGESVDLEGNSNAIPLRQVFQVPKDMWSIINADPRFSIFLGYLNYRDNLKKNMLNDFYGFEAMTENETIDRLKNDVYNPDNPGLALGVRQYSLILPTNDAFKNIGFNSLEDVIAFSNSRSEPYINPDLWDFEPGVGFTVDSLLSNHMIWYQDSRTAGEEQFRPPTFYIYSYMFTEMFYGGVTADRPEKDFDFSVAKKIGIKGSSYPAANLIETDIRSMNGPLHVVDAILIPKDFKIN